MDQTQTSILVDRSIHRFAIKTAIVAVAVTASAWIVLGQLENLIDTRVGQIRSDIRAATRVNGKVFWGRLEENIVKAADPSNDLSPERKATLLAAVRTLADRWRPFLAEIAAELRHYPGPRAMTTTGNDRA
jgi:hypothetical protein